MILGNARDLSSEVVAIPITSFGMLPPASVWTPSQRKYQPNPPGWDYGTGTEVKRLSVDGDPL